MSSIKVQAAKGGWRVCYGEELVSCAADEATAFQAALDYCSKLFLSGIRAQVVLDKPAFSR
jgi:hypothetical protein